jgi:plastocyanin
MSRTRIYIALAAATTALAVAVAPATATTPPTLTATVGPGFTIVVKKGTVKVIKTTTLKAGKYKIVVKDLSNIHNFHLIGPGLNKKTGVAAKGTFTWIVTLRKGIYRFLCDPHATLMKGSFKVA